MGAVDAFSIAGLRCYFGSNDHYPHHFHVLKRGYWVIRVYFLQSNRKGGLKWDYKSQWRGEVGAEEEQALLKLVLAHKKELLGEWNDKVCVAREKRKAYGQKRKPGGARRG